MKDCFPGNQQNGVHRAFSRYRKKLLSPRRVSQPRIPFPFSPSISTCTDVCIIHSRKPCTSPQIAGHSILSSLQLFLSIGLPLLSALRNGTWNSSRGIIKTFPIKWRPRELCRNVRDSQPPWSLHHPQGSAQSNFPKNIESPSFLAARGGVTDQNRRLRIASRYFETEPGSGRYSRDFSLGVSAGYSLSKGVSLGSMRTVYSFAYRLVVNCALLRAVPPIREREPRVVLELVEGSCRGWNHSSDFG